MDSRMATVMANHQTILTNQEYVITQLTHQHDCLEKLKIALADNTEVSEEVRELLAALNVFGKLAKWSAVTGGALFSAWHGVKAGINFWR
jgi:hypothetical protein